MPALDFPTSPTNGQIFENWIYSSAKQAWQSRPLTPAKTVNSPVAPSSPAAGDQWFNTDTGQLFIYYTDANTSQWVESRAPITADGYISPNYIINGGFDIWQRGTSHSSNLGFAPYTADRWQFTYASGSTGTISRSTDIPANVGVQYSLSMAMTNSQDPRMIQKIESVNAAPLAGKPVTLSFWAKSTVGSFLLGVFGQIASATDNWSSVTNAIYQDVSLTSSWQRFSITATIPSTVANGIQIVFLRASTSGAASTTLIAGVQLEEGSVATPFRRNANSIAGELAACQRYYYRFTQEVQYQIIGLAYNWGNSEMIVTLPHPVQMRYPTSTTYSAPSATYFLGNGTNYTGATNPVAVWANTRFIGLNFTGTGAATNQSAHFRPVINTFFEVSAEL
jgi:hypothetical protein